MTVHQSSGHVSKDISVGSAGAHFLKSTNQPPKHATPHEPTPKTRNAHGRYQTSPNHLQYFITSHPRRKQ